MAFLAGEEGEQWRDISQPPTNSSPATHHFGLLSNQMQAALSGVMLGVPAGAATGTTESDDTACSSFQTDQLSIPKLGLPSINSPRICQHFVHNPSKMGSCWVTNCAPTAMSVKKSNMLSSCSLPQLCHCALIHLPLTVAHCCLFLSAAVAYCHNSIQTQSRTEH